jgi:hypothetical protein
MWSELRAQDEDTLYLIPSAEPAPAGEQSRDAPTVIEP